MEVLRTPEERFEGLPDYPFAPHWVEIDGATDDAPDLPPLRVHVIDEGPRAGPVALLLHGNPTWSFLYRHMIPLLAARGVRVVAPDLIGFGKSDKPAERRAHSYAGHVAWMRRVLDALGLEGITLFGQDWGGLIGLRLLADRPERFARVMVGNTALPTGDAAPSPDFLAWRDYTQTNAAFRIGGVVHRGTVRELSDEERRAYDAPFPDERYKAGPRELPMMVPVSPDDPARADQLRAWQVLERWERPFLCCFSDRDPIMRGADRPFRERIPGARGQPHFTVENAGHFLQEDAGALLAERLAAFMGL